MKTRRGFVSNSSSSSFIVLGTPPERVENVELNIEQIKKVIKDLAKKFGELRDYHGTRVFLTRYFSDGSQEDIPSMVEAEQEDRLFDYDEGDHGGPYWQENYVCLRDNGAYGSVWIKKKHAAGAKADDE